MHLITSTSVVTLLSCVSSIYGHATIADAYGNVNQGIRGRGLGTSWSFNKGPYGTDLHPWQSEVSVFANTVIPCCHKPRVYQAQGCGLSLGLVWRHEIKPSAWLMLHGWHSLTIQNVFQAQRSYSLDVPGETSKFVASNAIPQISAGGWLRMRIHQVNADGAGPYKCKIDPTGTGRSFGSWLTLKENVPGNTWSINAGTVHKPNLWITAVIPTTLKCTGVSGSRRNMCLMRCENTAKNGPFGGCVAVQQIITEAPKPKPLPKPVATPVPVKPVPVAPPTKEELKVAMGGEEYSKEETEAIMEQKLPVTEKEVLAEAKEVNQETAKKDENEAMEETYY
ncbi:hypothetical protein TWF730_009399 [Orbilia blumenaviensis]|uniref:Uncharacterized protein n=1 Tax=Orbilia blumenaviensis TaxID=1796055 RepID=A0AAV9UZ35_9PEZI